MEHGKKDGDTEMEVRSPMRGFPRLKEGMKVKGKLIDIKNRWLKFDGNVPHAVVPYDGQRYSVVFFTRRGWLKMRPDARERLLEFDFRTMQ